MPALECQDRASRSPARHAANRRLCQMLEDVVVAAFAVSREELRSSSRRRREVAFARQSAIYLAHVALGLSLTAAGDLFHRDRTTAAHACHRVEDRRDDPSVDRLLQALEELCAELRDGAARAVEAAP